MAEDKKRHQKHFDLTNREDVSYLRAIMASIVRSKLFFAHDIVFEDPLDIVQNVLLKVIRSQRNHGRSVHRTDRKLFFRCLSHEIISRYRHYNTLKKRGFENNSPLSRELNPDIIAAPDAKLYLKAKIEQIFDEIAAELREISSQENLEILFRVRIWQHTLREEAERHGVTVSAIEKRLFRMYPRLRALKHKYLD